MIKLRHEGRLQSQSMSVPALVGRVANIFVVPLHNGLVGVTERHDGSSGHFIDICILYEMPVDGVS